MNISPFQNLTLRIITVLCLVTLIFSSSVSAQADPQTEVAIAGFDSFQQISAGKGWLVFGERLYWTYDDGAVWTDITPAQSKLESVTFLDSAHGFALLSDTTGYELAVTRDGGVIWQIRALDLPRLAQIDAPVARVFMSWRTELHGWMVFKLATGNNFSRGILFTTMDGGVTWNEGDAPLGEPAYFKSGLDGWMAGGPAGDQFFRTRDGGLTWQPELDGVAPLNEASLDIEERTGIVAISMSTSESGWAKWEAGECSNTICTREAKLLVTRDGVHWESMRLPNGQTSLRESFSNSGKSAFLPDADTKAYSGQGFDICEIRSLTQMQTWWNSSPYNAVNLYFGGISRGCSNSLITSSYLSQLNAQGWRFIPTWVGLQASCTGYLHRMSSDPALAYLQGVAEADAAVTSAQALGLTDADGTGTIIYFDLEAYDTSNSNCRAAVNAFINGWTYQMHARGNLAGVYGASCASAPADWWNIPNIPDALWIANWYGGAGSVSYMPTASVWNAACLSNSLWSNHQRLRQYAGDHSETWGGLALPIDSNVLDGPLTVPNGMGDAALPSSPSYPEPGDAITLDRMDDIWLRWKTNGDACSIHIKGSSLDVTVAGICSTYQLGYQYGGAYSWQVTASNDLGVTLGPIWYFNVRPNSPSGLTALPASSTRVNLTWQAPNDEPVVDSYLIYADGVQVGSVAGGVTSYQVQNLSCNTSHSHYVKAVRQGVQSIQSNTSSATTGSCAPILISPLDGMLVNSLQPTFLWQAVGGTAYYQIQVSTSATFSTLVINARANAATYVPTIKLLANKLYYWRVRAIGSFGTGSWASSSFTTPYPPPAPSLISPRTNGLVTDYSPRFDWQDVIVPAGTMLHRYQIQVAASVTFATLIHNESVTLSEFTPQSDFLPNARYYWRVQAVNTLGQSGPWSAVWNFRSAILPPDLVSPTDGTALFTRRPAFDWNNVAGASSYTLQISTASNFSSLLKAVTILGSTSMYTMTTDLPASMTLYWRVRANGINGPSLWSDVWSFRTAALAMWLDSPY